MSSAKQPVKSLRTDGSFVHAKNPNVAIQPYKRIYAGLLDAVLVFRPSFHWTKPATVIEDKLSPELLHENVGRINKKVYEAYGPHVLLTWVFEVCILISIVFTIVFAIARGQERGSSESSTVGLAISSALLGVIAIVTPFVAQKMKKDRQLNALLQVQAWLESTWNPKMERHGVEWTVKTTEEAGIKAPCSHVLELACYPGTIQRGSSYTEPDRTAREVMLEVADSGAVEEEGESDSEDSKDII